MFEQIQQLDGAILLFLQAHVRNSVLTALLVPLTLFGEGGALWIVLSLGLMGSKRTRKAGWMALLAMLLCHLVNEYGFKSLVARPRPFTVVEGLDTLVKRPRSWSFPSGHACSSFASASTFWRGLRDKGVDWFRYLAVFLAFLMAFSRNYVGVHYPTDVLCGALVGLLGAWIVWKGLHQRYDTLAGGLAQRREHKNR